jgi:hypothetical protein
MRAIVKLAVLAVFIACVVIPAHTEEERKDKLEFIREKKSWFRETVSRSSPS